MAVDPSSRRTGVAIMTDDERLVQWHVIVGDASQKYLARSVEMARSLVRMACMYPLDEIVVEIPAPQAPGGHAYQRGQAAYGFSVGTQYAYLRLCGPTQVPIEAVRSDVWTRRIAKRKRQQTIAALHPTYNPTLDPGGDASDAIGLALYWLESRKICQQQTRADG